MRTARWQALAAFAALTIPFGIVAHLASEFFGLGWRDDADVAFSIRHLYLAVIAVSALIALALSLRRVPRNNRRRAVAELVDALPLGGRGLRFGLLSFALQFGFFAITQIGEGCPLCGGDVLIGILAAAFASLAGALAVSFGKSRLLELACELVWFVPGVENRERPLLASKPTARIPRRAKRRAPYAFRYRPPPALRPNFSLI